MSKELETKKVVRVNETELVNMINDLVETEVQKSKKTWLAEEKAKWIQENAKTDEDKVTILESKIANLEKLISEKIK